MEVLFLPIFLLADLLERIKVSITSNILTTFGVLHRQEGLPSHTQKRRMQIKNLAFDHRSPEKDDLILMTWPIQIEVFENSWSC